MDSALCNIIYVDRVVREDRLVSSHSQVINTNGGESPVSQRESAGLEENVRLLLESFGSGMSKTTVLCVIPGIELTCILVHLCATGTSCISRLFDLQDGSMVGLKPTIVLIDTPHDERIPEDRSRSRSPSPHSKSSLDTDDIQVYSEEGDAYGLQLLQRIVSEAHLRNVSKLIVPIPIINFPNSPEASEFEASNAGSVSGGTLTPNRRLLKRCLDLGAVDVIVGPMHVKSVTSLELHAYRAHKDAAKDQQMMLEFRRGRKRSWIGIEDDRPHAYLREAMVSTLMKRICQMEDKSADRVNQQVRIVVSAARKSEMSTEIAKWHFCAHDYTDDELIVIASLMFKHAFSMPELENWRIPTGMSNPSELLCSSVSCTLPSTVKCAFD